MSAPDPILVLCAEARTILAHVNDHATDGAESEAGSDRLSAIDIEMIATRATTLAGAIAGLEWALETFRETYDQDQGGRLIVALMTGTLDVLRAQGGAA